MSPHPPVRLSALFPPAPPPPVELGAIHKILHLSPQTFSYNLAINLPSLIGFNIRSASTAMNASMIRFALKIFPQANEVYNTLIQATLECVPFRYLSAENGVPVTPGWDSPAYLASLAHALQQPGGQSVNKCLFTDRPPLIRKQILYLFTDHLFCGVGRC